MTDADDREWLTHWLADLLVRDYLARVPQGHPPTQAVPAVAQAVPDADPHQIDPPIQPEKPPI